MGNLIETATWAAGVPYFEADAILTGGPDCPDNIPIQALANRTAFLKKQIDDAVSGALTIEYADRLKTVRSIAMTGDGSWAVTFDGSGNVSAAMTLANTGVVAGTYPIVTVDAKGRVIAARALQSADLPANLALSGAPTVPTAAPGTNNAQVVNAAFVQAAIAALVASSPAALDTLNELAAALGNDPNFAATITNALAGKVGKDAQGNIGIGVVPKSWDTMFPVIQQNAKTVYAADVNSSYYGTNWYRTAGVYKRLADGYGLMYQQDSAAGKHFWKTAPTGLAESTVAWTTVMSLDSTSGILDVPGGITTATPGATDKSPRAATTAWCWPRTALAWVSFNGTTGAIRSSFNVSSVTRNAAGDYTIAFTNALADSNFSFALGVGRGSTNIDCLANLHHSYTRNTTNVRIGTTIASQAATTYYQDMPDVSLIIFGN